MKKRALSLFLALVLCLGLAAPASALSYGEEYSGYNPAYGQQYADVPATHWASQSIQTCSERGWFNGYPDGTFRPEGLIRRDEAAKVFAMALGLELEDHPTLTFTDTSDNWAKAYIEATKVLFPNAANLQGTSSFRPTQTITREETIYALVVAWRYASKATNADLSILNMFSDSNSISAGVKPYMAVAVQEGLVAGLPNGTIAAQKGLSRAEFATLLARALNHGYGPDDTAAPKIELDHYDAVTTDQQAIITGTVTPVRGTTLTLDGKTVSLDKNGAFTASIRLSLGDNALTFEAVNLYGIKSQKAVSIKYSLEDVSIRILSTIPFETEQETVDVNGKINNYTNDCTFTVNDRVTNVDSDGYFNLRLDLEEGENTFELAVLRQNEQVADQSFTVTRTVEEEPEPTPTPTEEPTPPQQPELGRGVTASGKCGENVLWKLYENGEMVISGEGNMRNYGRTYSDAGEKFVTEAPWGEYWDVLRSVTIENGVTNIGDSAFSGCSVLTSIIIPDGVTSIGEYAFAGCSVLASITIPDSVTNIGEYAFEECIALSGVTIPDGVASIEGYVFSGCTSLASITIPDSVTNIGVWAFAKCTALDRVTIPASVTRIGWNAFFGCTCLRSVTIENGVANIGEEAFSRCTALASITIPNSVTCIDKYAFYECTSLADVTIEGSVTSIGDETFYGCTSLISISLPGSVTSIGYKAFYNCTALTYVYYDGTSDQWSEVNINSENNGNGTLMNAYIYCNATDE